MLGARLLSAVRAPRIVLLSSAAVYAGLVGAVSPELAVQPTMPYALSKLYVEGFVRSRLAAGAAEGTAIIRLYNAYGPGERPTRLVPAVVAAMRSGTNFRLTAAVDSLSDPVHVDDVAAALVAAATSDASGTWDLCGGDPRPLPDQVPRIARALGRDDGKAAQAVFDLAKANGAPVALRDIGMQAGDLDKACDIALQNQYPNPRPLEARAIRELLQAAWEGARPG